MQTNKLITFILSRIGVCLLCGLFVFSNSTQGLTQSNLPIQGNTRIQKARKFTQKLRYNIRKRKGEAGDKAAHTALAITLGAFGVHRLYLGTADHIPFIYTITLGGGIYVVPVVDIIAVLTSKDYTRYKDDPHFLMWAQ